jgi:hypothetical protein
MSVATWRKPTVYIGRPRLEHPTHDVFHVIATPWPIYRAEIRQTRLGGPWEITWHTGALTVGESKPTAQAALQTAFKVIGETAHRDFTTLFCGDQRIIIGQQLCPYDYGADTYCQRSIEVGTIWCARHPWGKALTQ